MRARTRFILDIAIAAGLIAAYRPTWTGLTMHQWVSMAVIVPLLIHIVANWEWVVRIARTFLKRLLSASRANFVVDAALLVAFVAVMLSGIMISPIMPLLGIRTAQPLVWLMLHRTSANATIVLFALHAVLHRRWIAATAKRLLSATETAPRTGIDRTRRGRMAQAAAERKTAGRTVAVLGVTFGMGALIFGSVALAGPAFSEPMLQVQPGTAKPAPASPAQAGTRQEQPRKSVRVADSGRRAVPSAGTKRATTSAKKTPAPAARQAPRPIVMYCPRTGCSASSCHGTHGQSASQWYASH
jgi:hypothetical protein